MTMRPRDLMNERMSSHFSLLTSHMPAVHGGLAAVGMPLICLLLTACNATPWVNPWRDDSIPQNAWSTPSRDGILAADHAPAVRQSETPPIEGPVIGGQVPHFPLWWEDPFEDKGDQDNQFAWTWQDYFAMPYSYARWHVNTIGWPVSAVVTPPGTPMVSDGNIGRDHDAAKGASNDPTATPADFGFNESTETASAPAP